MKKITVLILINFYSGNEWFGKLWDNEWVFVTLIVSLIAILLSILRLRKPSRSKNRSEFENDIRILKQDIGLLRNDLKNRVKHDELRSLRDTIKEIQDKVAQLDQPRVLEWHNDRDENTHRENIYVQPHTQLLYAKQPDLDNGFSSGIIAETQNGEQVYEIETDGDTAVYRITNDINAQRYALSDPSYALKRACDFLNEPLKGCQIILIQEGTLTKTSGNWIIQQRAKIEFR